MKTSHFKRLVLGVCALAGWMGFFSCGLLVETVEWRHLLAPRSVAMTDEATAKPGGVVAPYSGSPQFAFIAATVCFTPTNLAFLTLLAGLVGGCASNVVAETLLQNQAAHDDPRRMMFLTETPWSAMMRAFIVYLCVIAGLYFAMDDPFKNSTGSQYMRLAGTLSLLAFVVGYDPSRIEQWLRLVPNPRPSQVVAVRQNEQGLQVTASQGPSVATIDSNAREDGSATSAVPILASANRDGNSNNRSEPARPKKAR